MKKKPSPYFFSIPFRNAEVWFIEFSGLRKDADKKREVIGIVDSCLPEIVGKIDLVIQYHETALDSGDLRSIFSFFDAFPGTFSKVVFSGSGFVNRMRIKRSMSANGARRSFPILFEDDLEKAKALAVS